MYLLVSLSDRDLHLEDLISYNCKKPIGGEYDAKTKLDLINPIDIDWV